MCATGFVPSLLFEIPFPVDAKPAGLDIFLWQWLQRNKRITTLVANQLNIIGMKHGIGNCGGASHDFPPAWWDMEDFDHAWLRRFVGSDYVFYAKEAEQLQIASVPETPKISEVVTVI